VRFRRPMPENFRFVKISRVKPNGAAVLSIAALLSRTEGHVSAARIALGAMANTPVRAHNLEAALRETTLTPRDIERAVVSAAADTTPRLMRSPANGTGRQCFPFISAGCSRPEFLHLPRAA